MLEELELMSGRWTDPVAVRAGEVVEDSQV